MVVAAVAVAAVAVAAVAVAAPRGDGPRVRGLRVVHEDFHPPPARPKKKPKPRTTACNQGDCL